MDQPSRRRKLDQPPLTPATDSDLQVLPAAHAQGATSPFVVVVQTPEEFAYWLQHDSSLLQRVQVERLLDVPEVWALAAQGTGETPLDVVLADPASEYSSLYRLVDVRSVRPVGVTLLAKPGFMKALRLAVSLQLPVRLLPGQPDAETIAKLAKALHFSLHDPMVETPVEFFHSLLAVFRGVATGTLWDFLESPLPQDWSRVEDPQSECASCPFLPVCQGYFKWPDANYVCSGVKPILTEIAAVADEISQQLRGAGFAEEGSPP